MLSMMKSIAYIIYSIFVLFKLGCACIDKSTYNDIDHEIEQIASSINNDEELVHFYGGIVRLAAHDFMDYDRNSDTPYGSDGCIDWDHEVNAGLQSIWCSSCPLTKLYNKKYTYISWADFWIISANTVMRILSKDQSFDLANTFLWGRKDASICKGSGNRIPTGTGTCRDVEDTMLDAMGLEWRDAVALLGAHTIGKGHKAVRLFARLLLSHQLQYIFTHFTLCLTFSITVLWTRWLLDAHHCRFSQI